MTDRPITPDPADSKAADASKMAKFAGGPTRKVKADETEIFNGK